MKSSIVMLLIALALIPAPSNAVYYNLHVRTPIMVVEGEPVRIQFNFIATENGKLVDATLPVRIYVYNYTNWDYVHEQPIAQPFASYSFDVTPGISEFALGTWPVGGYVIFIDSGGMTHSYIVDLDVLYPPIQYTAYWTSGGTFIFQGAVNHTFILEVYRDNVLLSTYHVNNITLTPQPVGEYAINVIDEHGWVNAFNQRNYWTGRGQPYIYDFEWKHKMPAAAVQWHNYVIAIAVAVLIIILTLRGERHAE